MTILDKGIDLVIATTPCPGPTVNVAATSGFYAQMTGLLISRIRLHGYCRPIDANAKPRARDYQESFGSKHRR